MELSCPHCDSNQKSSENQINIIRFGYFRRNHDKKLIQRFLCKSCSKTFSKSFFENHYRQHKPELNPKIMLLLCSNVSQRRTAKILSINKKTVVRKFLFMGALAKLALPSWNSLYPSSNTIEFDDLETFEHSKLKPISITLTVEYKTRRILNFSTARMPAKGHLVAKSFKKYGKRADERSKARRHLLNSLKHIVHPKALIKTDENPHYPLVVKKFFPDAFHNQYRGKRGAITGFGELKKIRFDPLFSLNHTCAMLRANINRLARKTWCTTKNIDRLNLHIALYSLYHNLNLKTSII